MIFTMELLFSLIILSAFTIIFAVVKSYYDNKRWEKHIYQILEQYRAKYGVDEECENLCFYDGDVE